MEDDFVNFKNKCIVIMCIGIVITCVMMVCTQVYMMLSLSRVDAMLSGISAKQEINVDKTRTILDKILLKR